MSAGKVYTLSVTAENKYAIAVSLRGRQGPPGPAADGGSVLLQYPAASALGGHRVAVLLNGQAAYADNANAAHAGLVIGVTTGAAAQGDTATIQSAGDLTEPTWNFTANQPVFLGMNGQLTQTPPHAAFSQIIGFAKSATVLFIQLEPPIQQV